MPARSVLFTSRAVPAPVPNYRARAPLTPQAEARTIIEKAVKQRNLLLAQGSGHLTGVHLRAALDRLITWLRYNPHPSIATLRHFHAAYIGDLRLVMPSTDGGASLLLQFDQLLQP